MISLHSDIMYTLLPYFDAKSMATLAQVSTAWKTIVYRPSVWRSFLWRLKESHQIHFHNNLEIPSNARHIGEPTNLCFHTWFESRQYMGQQNDLPREFHTAKDSKAMYSVAKKVWEKNKKPCVHIDHHIWTDVFRGRLFLNTMNPSDVERISFRIM